MASPKSGHNGVSMSLQASQQARIHLDFMAPMARRNDLLRMACDLDLVGYCFA